MTNRYTECHAINSDTSRKALCGKPVKWQYRLTVKHFAAKPRTKMDCVVCLNHEKVRNAILEYELSDDRSARVNDPEEKA